jgi:hypothetical protein
VQRVKAVANANAMGCVAVRGVLRFESLYLGPKNEPATFDYARYSVIDFVAQFYVGRF